MKTPRLESPANDALERLIDAGSRVRPMHEGERAALFARIESRKFRRARLKGWTFACAGVACALAVAALELSPGTPPAELDHLPAPSAALVGAAPITAADTPATALVDPTPGAAAEESRAAAAAGSAPAIPKDAAQSPTVRHLSVGSSAELEVDPDTIVALPSEAEIARHGPMRIRLQRGRVLASVAPRARDEPFGIETPHVLVSVVGTRFSVLVDAKTTTVNVEHGRVRVEKAGRSLLLDAGQTLRSDDSRFNPPPASQAQRDSACAAASNPPERRRPCLARVATGTGLAAENALLALGLLERDSLGDRASAVARFGEYQRRHPQGVLAPEVALALVQTLLMDGQPAAARAAADEHARRFPDDAATNRRLRELTSSAAARPAPAAGH